MTGRPAAFVDRDGTVMRDAAYVGDPRDVELLPGAASAIRRLNEADIPVIVVSNQSGIARGLFTEQDYEAVHRRLEQVLAAHGARIDATYICPHFPEISGPCDCRKPGLALFKRAIADHGLDPSRSLFVGDRWRDVAPALALGGEPVMLDVVSTRPEDRARARDEHVPTAASLAAAVERFLVALPGADSAQ